MGATLGVSDPGRTTFIGRFLSRLCPLERDVVLAQQLPQAFPPDPGPAAAGVVVRWQASLRRLHRVKGWPGASGLVPAVATMNASSSSARRRHAEAERAGDVGGRR
jgi:hypothetical protein